MHEDRGMMGYFLVTNDYPSDLNQMDGESFVSTSTQIGMDFDAWCPIGDRVIDGGGDGNGNGNGNGRRGESFAKKWELISTIIIVTMILAVAILVRLKKYGGNCSRSTYFEEVPENETRENSDF